MQAQAQPHILYVKPNEQCLDLLQRVDEQVDGLLRSGMRVRVVLVRGNPDKRTLSMVKKDKVSAIPTLVSPDGTKHVGVNNIKKALAGGPSARSGPRDSSARDDGDSYESFARGLMFEGGVPRTDPEEDEDRIDYKKLAARDAKKQPKHRRRDAPPTRRRKQEESDEDESDEEAPRSRGRSEEHTTRREVDYAHLDTSTIDQMDIPRPDNVADCNDDALAEEMLSAFRTQSQKGH